MRRKGRHVVFRARDEGNLGRGGGLTALTEEER